MSVCVMTCLCVRTQKRRILSEGLKQRRHRFTQLHRPNPRTSCARRVAVAKGACYRRLDAVKSKRVHSTSRRRDQTECPRFRAHHLT